MHKYYLKTAVTVSYFLMVAVNYLATALPIGGRDTGEISDSYPNLFAPAGYTFAIWGLIYGLLAAYVIFQFQRQDSALTERVNRIFIMNAWFNAAWIFAWHNNLIWLSLIIMLGLLVSLIMIAEIIRKSELSQRERWLVRLPFSVYFGWITVATIANATVFLVSINWNGFGLPGSVWMVAVLLVGAAIGSWRAWHDRNLPYTLVLLWAYSGILQKHISSAGFNGQYPAVIWTVGLCMAAYAAVALAVRIKGKYLNA